MPRGSKPGEHRGGRKPGTPNNATRDIRELAQVDSVEAVHELATLAGLVKGIRGAESEQARIAAPQRVAGPRAWQGHAGGRLEYNARTPFEPDRRRAGAYCGRWRGDPCEPIDQ